MQTKRNPYKNDLALQLLYSRLLRRFLDNEKKVTSFTIQTKLIH